MSCANNFRSATTTLELAFVRKPLRQICESSITAKRRLGQEVAEKLKHRIADLRAAKFVSDLLAGNPQILEGSSGQHYKVDLSDGYKLIFCSNHQFVQCPEIEGTNWSQVSRIKILDIRS